MYCIVNQTPNQTPPKASFSRRVVVFLGVCWLDLHIIMPEGPEIFLASLFINTVSQNRLYGGRVVKSEVSTKNPEVDWEEEVYRIHAVSRGKELKVTLCQGKVEEKGEKTLDIIFRFGMSGSFKFTPVQELPKHAHLR